MILSPNHIFMPIACLAVAGYGFIFSGANPTFTVDDKWETKVPFPYVLQP